LLGGGGGLQGDIGDGAAADVGEVPGDQGKIGGFGTDPVLGGAQVGNNPVRQGGGQIGGVGFEEKTTLWDPGGVFAGAAVVGPRERAAKADANVFGGEGGEGVGGAGVGVDEEPGGMGREVEENLQHELPGVAAVEGGGEGEFAGEVQLGAKYRLPVGIESVLHASIEADFADAGGARGEAFAQTCQPAGGAVADKPRMQAERAEDPAGMGVGEGGDGGPVGFGGGGDVEKVDAGDAGAVEDGGEVGGQPGILEVAMGVEPGRFFCVGPGQWWYAHGPMVKGRPHRVNLQSVGRLLPVWIAAALVSGCGTFNHYPQGMERTTLGALRRGDATGHQRTFSRRLEGRDGILFAMEQGRVAQLEGDFAISLAAFEHAIQKSREQDEQAVLSATGAAGQAGAVLVNDKAIAYRAPDYERTLVHHYQALNYLATNDLTGAGVEVRRANRVQEEARKRRETEIERARSKPGDESPAAEGDSALRPVFAGLDEMAGKVKFSFQNAATFYLSAVIWEMLGEPNSAYIDYKKAIEIFPDNPILQRDVIRLGKRLGMSDDLQSFSRRFPKAADAVADGTGEPDDRARLVVLYEEGLAPWKMEMSIAYPLPSAGSIGAISLPMYPGRGPPPVPVTVQRDGRALGRTEPICHLEALAARALQERMPGIVTRQVARVVTKGVAAKAARDQGGELAGLATTLYNVLSEQADLRSWLSLPAHIHIWSGWVEPGEIPLSLSAPGGLAVWSDRIHLPAEKTAIVLVTKIDLAVYSHVFLQP